jgi:hypothetical protein
MPDAVLLNSCCVPAAVAGCWLTCCGSGNKLMRRARLAGAECCRVYVGLWLRCSGPGAEVMLEMQQLCIVGVGLSCLCPWLCGCVCLQARLP